MKRGRAPVLGTVLLALAATSAGGVREDGLLPMSVFAGGRHKGICYEHAFRRGATLGYGTPASQRSLERLRALGVTWISITPFGFQRAPDDTSIRLARTDALDRLVAVTRQAHALGIRVMLKPHLWLRPPSWVGQIEHRTEDGWARWFAAYRDFIVQQAETGRRAGVDAFSIGNELQRTTSRQRDWRAIIDAVRAAYPGPVTYGANGPEVFDVRFWDALDFIGLSAYFPLVDRPSPTTGELVAAWRPIVDRLAALSARWRRPIVFTELGYRSVDGAAGPQWDLDDDEPINLTVQAVAYRAFFEAVWSQPWFGGVYWWKWSSAELDGGITSGEYSPIGKPAEQVIDEYY
jgi:hypothetical protein